MAGLKLNLCSVLIRLQHTEIFMEQCNHVTSFSITRAWTTLVSCHRDVSAVKRRMHPLTLLLLPYAELANQTGILA